MIFRTFSARLFLENPKSSEFTMYFEGQNAGLPKLSRLKNQKPAAGGANTAKNQQKSRFREFEGVIVCISKPHGPPLEASRSSPKLREASRGFAKLREASRGFARLREASRRLRGGFARLRGGFAKLREASRSLAGRSGAWRDARQVSHLNGDSWPRG